MELIIALSAHSARRRTQASYLARSKLTVSLDTSNLTYQQVSLHPGNLFKVRSIGLYPQESMWSISIERTELPFPEKSSRNRLGGPPSGGVIRRWCLRTRAIEVNISRVFPNYCHKFIMIWNLIY